MVDDDFNFEITRHNSSGHWSFLEWRRLRVHTIDRLTGKNHLDKRAAHVYGHSENWHAILDMPNLEELHLHYPTHEQWDTLSRLTSLKRLSLDSYRPKDLSVISPLSNLEELQLSAISGVTCLEHLGELKKLRAFSSYMLRGVKNFDGLSSAHNLRYINIDSSFDLPQKIESFDFLYALKNIEYLSLGCVRILETTHAALPITHCKKLKRLHTARNNFYLDDFALIEMGCQGVQGAQFTPVELGVSFSHGNRTWFDAYPWGTSLDNIEHIDMHRPLAPALNISSALLASSLTQPVDMGLESKKMGSASLLGRGERDFKSNIKNAEKRAQAHIEKYEIAKEKAKALLTP